MNVVERYRATYAHQPTDRVPIALSYFHAGFSRDHFQPLAPGESPVRYAIDNQLRYGFDPHLYVRGTGRDWFLAQPDEGQETEEYARCAAQWQVTQKVSRTEGIIRTDYAIATPGGQLTCVRRQTPDDFGTIEVPFIKDEGDIELLRHRPHPECVIDRETIRRDVADMGSACWPMVSIASVWTLASFFRGPDTIMMDLYDRPEWVKRFLALLNAYQLELVQEIARVGVDLTLRIDSSFVGFGLSRRMYVEFLQPHDASMVQAGHKAD